MKRKLILMVLIIFLSTGCTVQYNLNITEDEMAEDINVKVAQATLTPQDKNALIQNKNQAYINTTEYYDVTPSEDEEYFNVNYKYTHKANRLENGKLLNWCYHTRQITRTNKEIIISTEGPFDCLNKESRNRVDNAEINITTKLKVIKNNADKVTGNTYTWLVDENNYQNKPIYIHLKMPDMGNSVVEVTKNMSLVIITAIALASIVCIIILVRKKKNNRL